MRIKNGQAISIIFTFLFFSIPLQVKGYCSLIDCQPNECVQDHFDAFDENHFLKQKQLYSPRQNENTYNMYSSHKHRFLWLRVFKVASSSTRVFLKKNVEDLTQSRPTRLPKKFKDYFKFAFVRNPWDRVVSCYFHKVVTKEIPLFKECFDKDFDFFVDFINKTDLRTANAHIRLQTKLIPKGLDFIGKLDTFDQDFQHVCDVIGIEYHGLTHEHQTQHAHYSSYYTPRTRRIIAKKYEADIKAFGFKFETE
ncbi:MAG: sulfotransferase family 2 domain-containing protein [Parachlamydiaceae bacterium]